MQNQFSKIIFLIIVISSSLFSACSEKEGEVTPIDGRFEYNPLEVGFFREYEITLRDTSFLSNTDTTFFMKELVSEQESTNRGEEYIIHRFYKANKADTYKTSPDTIWKSIITPGSFINVENNIRFVRLKFPPELSLEWDGNEENNSNSHIYSIDSLDIPYTLHDTLNFEKTLFVSHTRKLTLIDTNIVFERYAEDVGLIERHILNSTYGLSGLNFTLETLFLYSQKIISSGYESISE